jgi:hypothetical protein
MFNKLPTSQWNISTYCNCKPIHGTRFSETGRRMSTKIDHFFVFVSITIKTSNRNPQWNFWSVSPRPHSDLLSTVFQDRGLEDGVLPAFHLLEVPAIVRILMTILFLLP